VSTEIVHVPLVALVFSGHMFDVDHATVLCTDPTLAERLAELIERHGLADVPDHLPDAITWAPPHPDDRLIDWRLPENPHRTNEGTLP